METIFEDADDHRVEANGVTLDTPIPEYHPTVNALHSDIDLVKTVPAEHLHALNIRALEEQPPVEPGQLQFFGPVVPLLPGTEYPVSELAAVNWFAYHRAHHIPFDISGVQMLPLQTPFTIVNRRRYCNVGPRFLVTRQMQSTLLKIHLARETPLLNSSSSSALPIHIFVDASNIFINWLNILKAREGIAPTMRITAPPFSFSNFDYILRAGRPVAKAIAAGSAIPGRSLDYHFVEASQVCGYNVTIMPRVDNYVGSDGRKKEHFVDEKLHLVILATVVDCEPTTMVVATGDGNIAEHSDGFLANIERALQKGWHVELVAFSESISHSYRTTAFAEKYGSRFKIRQLDEYAEFLFAMCASS